MYLDELELEERLNAKRKARLDLEMMLQPYGIRSKDIQRRTYIDDIPYEILTDILQMTLVDDHLQIRRLLLVSRRWNKFIVETPELWTIIQLHITNTIDDDPPTPAYVRTCYTRSAQRPLEVIFDLYHIRDRYQMLEGVSKCITGALRRHYLYSSFPDLCKEEGWTDYKEEECEDENGLQICKGYSYVDGPLDMLRKYISSLATALNFEDGIHIARWTRVTILGPPCQNGTDAPEHPITIQPLAPFLSWTTPNLQQLRINSFEDLDGVDPDNFRNIVDLSLQRLAMFPNETLRKSLKRLTLFEMVNAKDLDFISGLDNLEELTIEPRRWGGRPLGSPLVYMLMRKTFRLELVALKRLTLIGKFSSKIDLHAPKLETLSVSYLYHPIVPIINAETLEWKLSAQPKGDEYDQFAAAVASLGTARQLGFRNMRSLEDLGPLMEAHFPPTLELLSLEMTTGEVKNYDKSDWS